MLAYPLTPRCMSGTTLSRTLPRITHAGSLDIPPSDWLPLRALLAEQFGASLRVHEHDAGAYHGNPPVPVDHYLVEITLDSESDVGRVIEAVDPMIEEIIDRNTTREFASSR